MDVNPGIASSYIFSLKPGDKVIMSGPYGEFRPQYGTGREMIWVGGGAGMAPLRAQIMHMLKGHGIAPEDRQRPMHYFYGARALEEIPFLDDFLQLSSSLRRTSLTSTSISPSTVQIQRQMQQESNILRAS